MYLRHADDEAPQSEHHTRAIWSETRASGSVCGSGRNVVAVLQVAVVPRCAPEPARSASAARDCVPDVWAARGIRSLAARPKNVLVFRTTDVHDDTGADLLLELQLLLVSESGSV